MEQDTATATPAKTKGKGRADWMGPGRTPIAAPWGDIRDAVASGLTFEQVAKQFAEYHPRGWQTFREVIAKRAQREEWLVPSTAISKIKRQAAERLRERGLDVGALSTRVHSAPRDPEKTGTLLLENAQELAQSGSMIGLKLLHGQLQDAERNEGELAPLVDAKGIVTAIRGMRMAAGLDRPQIGVALNLWQDGAMSPGTSAGTLPSPAVETWLDAEEA